jgi:MFS family permease
MHFIKNRILFPFRQSKTLNTLFLANIFISLHYASVIYINSSFLSKFFSETEVSYLYIIGSALDAIMLLYASRILEILGNYRFTIIAVSVEFLSTIGLLFGNNPSVVAISFLLHVFTISLILYNMDIFVEAMSPDENKTASIRAAYLTLTSIAIVISPAIVSFVVIGDSYKYVYLISALFLLPLYHLFIKLKRIKSENIFHIKIRQTVAEYIRNKNLYNVFVCQSILQFFYAYMVIYMPIYLSKYVGFEWSEIGIMFTIMLLPFVIFELPVGELEDFQYGEKEFLSVGLIITGLSTIFLSFITAKVFWIWTAVLFISRIGASFVEISSESYFFKNVDKDKTDIIGFFRVSRPLSFIIAPILATIIIGFLPFQFIFTFIGIIMILGLKYSLALKDTR